MNNINELYLKLSEKRAKGEDVEKDTNNLIAEFEASIFKAIKAYIPNAQKDDFYIDMLMQDGRLAVAKAIITFKNVGDAEFSTFAYTCIDNAIKDGLRQLNSKKYKNLLEAVSMDKEIFENETVADTIADYEQDIEQSYINKKRIAKAENNMTKEEIEIVNLTAAGYTQKEIAKKLNKKPKDIDNILARIRKNNKEN